MTLSEVLVASLVAGFIVVAAMTMYVTSVETWQQTSARLEVQRDASLVVDRMTRDIRAGSTVIISNANTRMDIFRRTVSGSDSLTQAYYLDGNELKNLADTALLHGITALSFTSGNGRKVTIQMRLEDDLGTSAISEDDEGIMFETVAVTRNRG
jgi:Tfp pilus assembly protein PilW